MKKQCRTIWLLLFILTALAGSGQALSLQDSIPHSNLRQKKIPVADTIFLDSLSIIPKTFVVAGVLPSSYKLDFVKAILFWNNKPAVDSITISYRVFPYKLNPVAQRLSFDSISKIPYIMPFTFNRNEFGDGKSIFDFGNLSTQGSFGRQIAFGNNQDAVVNSTLNLQMQGMLGDSIEINAAISDNNIPLQPEGTTQQLNEFDQVFLQFKKRNWQLNLGDLDIRQNESYFLNFYKRLQGVSFQTNNAISKKVNSNTLVSGSIAKGKFTRNVFQGSEGNQGPYRLTGANNEFFFIVLGNTERVFIDGELLQRGEDQDYVINYNTAEITFTPKRMITKDTRIQVEFEYADRNYLNSNLYLNQQFTISNKVKIRFGAFNNSDAKNSPINQTLDNKQKQFLANLGDSVQNAFYQNAVIDTFAADRILYKKIYFNAGLDSFYQYSTNPDSAKYNLSFVLVGDNKGNYIPDFNGANGKVYKYVPPVGNVKQGNYEPAIILVAPKKQQLYNLGVDYAIDKNTMLKTEVAMSRFDVNTFSKKDNGDDDGYAAKIQFSNIKKLAAAKQLQLTTKLDYEYVQEKFKPLERLRQVEFTRDWGLPIVLNAATEQIIKANAQLQDNKQHFFSYQFTNYHRSDNYNGIQNSILHRVNVKGWNFNNQFILTNYNSFLNKGYFVRPVIDMNKDLKHFFDMRLGFRYALEENKTRNKAADTLDFNSFSFDTYSVYLQSGSKRKNKYGITFFTRSDKYATGKELVRGDRSYNINLQTELTSNQHHRLFFNTTYRKLKVLNSVVSKQKDDNTILGRVNYEVNVMKGFLTGFTLYELGTGQEQKRDFAYLEVPAGTGVYAWNDYNGDGVQQLNEFEVAAFYDQRKFIRVYTPSNEFIKANYNTLNYSVELNPRSIITISKAKGLKKFISKTNLRSSMEISKKSIATGDFKFNPFNNKSSDTALLTFNTAFLNTFSYNRFRSPWSFDITNNQRSSKALLTYGYESTRFKELSATLRFIIVRTMTLEVMGKKGNNSLNSDNAKFQNRNYNIHTYSAGPKITFVRGTTFSFTTSYLYEQKKNDSANNGGQKAVSNSINFDSKYNILRSASINAKFTFNNINFTSPNAAYGANSTVGYNMLNGLLPGKNYLWNLSFTKTLMNNLEVRFEYEGRKPGSANTVHRGTASLNALF